MYRELRRDSPPNASTPMKLAAQLILLFLVAVLALTGANAYLAVRAQQEAFAAEQEEYAQRLGQAVTDPVVVAWRNNGRSGVLTLIQRASAEHHDIQIRWVSLSIDGTKSDAPAVPSEQLPAGKTGEIISVTIRDNSGQGQLHTYFPIELTPGQNGAIEFTRSTAALDRVVRHTVNRWLLVVGGTSIFAVLIALFAGVRLVGRPLEQLVAKTRRASQGDFSGPLELHRRDELGQLAEALNEMCAQLSQSEVAIRSEATARIAALEQLRHADRLNSVGRMAAGIAHELGTPLNVVAGRAGLIASGRLTEAAVTQSAVTIKTEADKITTIVRQLLDFARRDRPKREQTDLAELIRRTVALLTPLADDRGGSLCLACDDGVPAIQVDAGRIEQVLTNLIVNALHATRDGGKVTVGLRLETIQPPGRVDRPSGEYVCLFVKDNGAGMTTETLENIFVPFFTTKDVGEGTGLGLSIAHGIVEEHGGWIGVTSQVGAGTCFSVYLPVE